MLITIASQGDNCLAYNHCWSRRQLPGLQPLMVKKDNKHKWGQLTQMGTTNTNGDNQTQMGQKTQMGTTHTNGDNQTQMGTTKHKWDKKHKWGQQTTNTNWTTHTNGNNSHKLDNRHKWGQLTQMGTTNTTVTYHVSLIVTTLTSC